MRTEQSKLTLTCDCPECRASGKPVTQTFTGDTGNDCQNQYHVSEWACDGVHDYAPGHCREETCGAPSPTLHGGCPVRCRRRPKGHRGYHQAVRHGETIMWPNEDD